jgi:hypothetical protein
MEMSVTPGPILDFCRHTSINDDTNEQDTATMNAGAWRRKTATGREEIPLKASNRRQAK